MDCNYIWEDACSLWSAALLASYLVSYTLVVRLLFDYALFFVQAELVLSRCTFWCTFEGQIYSSCTIVPL